MAKKKKRKLQPHEKFFVRCLVWAVCIALAVTVLSWPRERSFAQAEITVHRCDTFQRGRHGRRTELQIVSTEGQIFTVQDSEIPFVDFRALLTPGEQVEIEYFEDWYIRLHPLGARPVSKLTYNGQILALNTPVDNTAYFVLLWICPALVLFGFLNWASGEHLLRKWKKKREKERKRRKREEKTHETGKRTACF